MELSELLSKIPVETIVQAIGAAGILSIVIQKLKNWLSLQSSRTINFLNALLSTAVVLGDSLLRSVSENPSMLTGKALSLMSLTVLVYSTPGIGIKSIAQLLTDAKMERERKSRVNETVQDQNLLPVETVAPQVPTADTPATVEPTDDF